MRVLIVDDDEEFCARCGRLLFLKGHGSAVLRNGSGLITELHRETYDLILLDWNLPDVSGQDLLRSIRSAPMDIGIVLVMDRAEQEDIADALLAGANDYIVRPEHDAILMARIEAAARPLIPIAAKQRIIDFDHIRFDRLTKSVSLDDETVKLSHKEFALALLFFENMNRDMSRRYILGAVWHNIADISTRTLDMHVSRLRSKLHMRGRQGYRIVSVSGYGYRLEAVPID